MERRGPQPLAYVTCLGGAWGLMQVVYASGSDCQLWGHTAGVQGLALLFTSCVTLRKLLNFSGPLFSLLLDGNSKNITTS